MESHCSHASFKNRSGCHSTERWALSICLNVPTLFILPLIIIAIGEVYAIGGYNGVKTVDVVEKYNPRDGTWKEVSPLIFGRSVPGIAVAYLWPVQSTMKSFWEPESQL